MIMTMTYCKGCHIHSHSHSHGHIHSHGHSHSHGHDHQHSHSHSHGHCHNHSHSDSFSSTHSRHGPAARLAAPLIEHAHLPKKSNRTTRPVGERFPTNPTVVARWGVLSMVASAMSMQQPPEACQPRDCESQSLPHTRAERCAPCVGPSALCRATTIKCGL